MNRRKFLTGMATTAAASASVAIPLAVASASTCPLMEIEQRWLHAARAEDEVHNEIIRRLNGRSVFDMTGAEIMEMSDAMPHRDKPIAEMKAAAALMAALPAKDHRGIEAKLRVALGKGRVMGKGGTNATDTELVESVLADIACIPRWPA